MKWIVSGFLILILGFASYVFAQSEGFSIEGELLYNNSGDLYISLVNEDIFSEPMAGVQRSIIKVDKGETGQNRVAFRFQGVAPGVYGIRCFQDVNGNGILDKGMFGPKEPWGMSWQGKKPAAWPKFKHICFEVTADISNMIIDLQK